MTRFVSAGAINAETGDAIVVTADQLQQASSSSSGLRPGAGEAARRKSDWETVQKELEAERRRREEARAKAVEGGEKSLYDILQANKAAKQAAFEEQNKIKNQFRPLDDDEIEFLDEVREKRRTEEENVRRETEEGIAKFRRAQQTKRPGDGEAEDEADKGDEGGVEEWSVGPRKRRRKERSFGVRREKSGEKEKVEDNDGKRVEKTGEAKKDEGGKKVMKEMPETNPPVKPKGGLVAYGSDSDDD